MQYIALLRGINVGGKNTVEMSRLKVLFETMGFENVRTYINSGNVIFESGEMSEKTVHGIESAFEGEFGFGIRFLIIDENTLRAIASEIPEEWENNSEQKTDIFFLWEKFQGEESMKMIRTNPAVDDLRYAHGAILWHIEKKNYTKSKMHDFIGTILYKNMTARNVNTVRKLVALL